MNIRELFETFIRVDPPNYGPRAGNVSRAGMLSTAMGWLQGAPSECLNCGDKLSSPQGTVRRYCSRRCRRLHRRKPREKAAHG